MNDALLLALCLLCGGLCPIAGRFRWAAPFIVFFGFWAVIFLARIVLPVGQAATTSEAALILGSGLVAAAVGVLIASPAAAMMMASPEAQSVAVSENSTPWTSDNRRLTIAGGVLLASVLAGLWQYRGVIGSRAGSAFGDLTRQQVLYYQIYESGGSSPVLLLISLAPVLAAVGVVLGRRHAAGYLLTAAALACSMQDPSRTATISGGALALIVFLGLRDRKSAPRSSGVVVRRARLLVLFAVVASITVVYFNAEAVALKKAGDAAPGIPANLQFLSGPLTYATGSPSALAVAVSLPSDAPPETDPLRSIWLVQRTLAILVPGVPKPDPVAGYVAIPELYNTYTMFGDLYFDFGLVGVVIGSLGLGMLASWWHRRLAAEPTPVNAWITAVLIVVLFGGATGFRLFWLDTAIWLVVGFVVLSWASSRQVSRHPWRALSGEPTLRESDSYPATSHGRKR